MKREELLNDLYEWLDGECIPATMTADLSHDFADILRSKLDAIKSCPALPPAEGADKVQRCPVCMGRGLVPNNFYATTSGIGSTTQTYLPEKCRTCNGAGVIIPPYPKLQPTAEGAEEILTSLIKSLGEPTKTHNHIYEIRPYTVEGKTEWWMFNKGVGSGEPLAQWLNKFATLHAQKMAEKMVEERLRKELVKYCNRIFDDDEFIERSVNEYLKSR